MSNSPAGAQLALDEHRPLLSPDLEANDETKPLNWPWYTFYSVSLALALLGIVLLIKGFIDAGDTDVCVLSFNHTFPRLNPLVSSISQVL